METYLEQTERRMMSRSAILAIVVFAVAGLVRMYDLGVRGLWEDEFYSLAGSAGRYPDQRPIELNRVMRGLPAWTDVEPGRPWWTIWAQMRQGTHPPLYIIALRLWREVFGNGDVAAQLFSVVCSMAALGLLWDSARRLWGYGVANWAAALMAVAWPQVHYAQEIRPYAMLMALGMGAMNALVRIEQGDPAQRRRWWTWQAVLGVLLVAMALTHYFAAGALLSVGAYALTRFHGRRLRDTVITLGMSAFVFLAAWGPSMWAQRNTTRFAFLENPHANPALVTVARVDQLPVRYLVDADWRPWLPGVGVVLLAGGAVLAWKTDRRLLLPLIWLAGTMGFIMLLDIARSTQHVYLTRYTVLASPALYLLIPAALYALRPIAAHIVCGVLVALCAAALPYYYLNERESWRGFALELKESASKGDGVLLAFDGRSNDPWSAIILYVALSHYAHDPARQVLIVDRPPSGETLREMGSQRVWAVFGTPGGRDVAPERLQQMLPGYRVVRKEKFSTAEVYELEPGT